MTVKCVIIQELAKKQWRITYLRSMHSLKLMECTSVVTVPSIQRTNQALGNTTKQTMVLNLKNKTQILDTTAYQK